MAGEMTSALRELYNHKADLGHGGHADCWVPGERAERYAEDAHHHEHDAKGLFTSKGAGGSKKPNTFDRPVSERDTLDVEANDDEEPEEPEYEAPEEEDEPELDEDEDAEEYAEWNKDAHPRGGTKNKGQFAKKGGGNAASSSRTLTRQGISARINETGDTLAAIMEEAASPIGDIRVHGMADSEPMVGVEIEGVKFAWNAAKGVPILTLYSAINRQLPEKLWQANSDVVASNQKNNQDKHWGKVYKIKSFRSVATGGDGKICSYKTPLDLATFAHESGHNFAKQLWGDVTPPTDSDYGKAQSQEQPVSEYGAVHPSEDFAEACGMYAQKKVDFGRDLSEHDRLKRDFPLKYAALQNLLGE